MGPGFSTEKSSQCKKHATERWLRLRGNPGFFDIPLYTSPCNTVIARCLGGWEGVTCFLMKCLFNSYIWCRAMTFWCAILSDLWRASDRIQLQYLEDQVCATLQCFEWGRTTIQKQKNSFYWKKISTAPSGIGGPLSTGHSDSPLPLPLGAAKAGNLHR